MTNPKSFSWKYTNRDSLWFTALTHCFVKQHVRLSSPPSVAAWLCRSLVCTDCVARHPLEEGWMQVGRERLWGKSTIMMASSLELFPTISASIVTLIIWLSCVVPCNSSNFSGMHVLVWWRQSSVEEVAWIHNKSSAEEGNYFKENCPRHTVLSADTHD